MIIQSYHMDELEQIKQKKLEELKQRYMNGGRKNMENIPDSPVKITDADFEEHTKKFETLVIDCWAPWCGPCRMLGPIIDELAKEMKGKIVFGKLNVDENPSTSGKFGVMSIPTLLIFKNGEMIDRLVGALPKEQLKQRFEQI